MSNIITAEIIADTTIESAAKGIATGLSNKTGSADACRWSYLANRAGVSLAELAKAATKIMAADPSSEKSSISKAAIEHRVNAYAFLVENGLPFQSSTVCLSYTLAQKPTASREFQAILDGFSDGVEPTRKLVEEALVAGNKSALQAIKDAKDNKPSEGGAEGDEDDKAAATVVKDSVAEILAYLAAQTGRTWSDADKKKLVKGFQAAIATLSA